MASDKKMLVEAASAAQVCRDDRDKRAYFIGAVGRRNDGVIVSSRNVSSTNVVPQHHAETRVVRKMTPDSTVWVARIRKDGAWAMAKPCAGCERRLRAAGVRRVVYTIGPDEWGVIDMRGKNR